jgi:hypothetical protein
MNAIVMMKKRMFFMSSLVLINSLLAFSQSIPEDVFEFPVKQGSTEWLHFETIAERIAALQIPSDVLATISTEGLLETCLAYPYLIDFFFCDNFQMGLKVLKAGFNGFKELFNRCDLPEALLKKYKNFSVEVVDIWSSKDFERGMFTFRHFVLEFMLAQDAVLKSLSLEQEKQLFSLCLEHNIIKRTYSDIFGNLNDVPSNLLYAKKAMNSPEFTFENNEQERMLFDFIQAPAIVVDQRIIGNIENYIHSKFK